MKKTRHLQIEKARNKLAKKEFLEKTKQEAKEEKTVSKGRVVQPDFKFTVTLGVIGGRLGLYPIEK